MQYKFKKVTEQPEQLAYVPSDNMNVNGKPLNGLVTGYTQLSVSGRGVISQNNNTTNVPLRDGAFFNYNQLEVRVLTVKYKIEVNSSEDLRTAYEELNQALDGRLDLTFDDEPNWHYCGYFGEGGGVEENTLSIVDEFTILCPDPYKYTEEQSGTSINLTYSKGVNPISIELTANTTTDITISNGRDDIRLNGHYSSGDKIDILWLDEHIEVNKNISTNILSDVVMFNYPENFKIKNGDTITVTGGTLVNVKWRDKRR